MKPSIIILLVVLLLLVGAAAALYFLGKKAQKKQAEQQVLLDQNKQTVSMLIIDKKRVSLKESGLPQIAIDQTPKYLRRSKVSGPQIMTLMCDDKIFDIIPIKKEVKAIVSGIYIMDVKALHGKLPQAEPTKRGRFKRWVDKLQEKAGAKPL